MRWRVVKDTTTWFSVKVFRAFPGMCSTCRVNLVILQSCDWSSWINILTLVIDIQP
jgi:hypothetical protein